MSNATIARPEEGCTRCACGAKYWDFNEVRQCWECASCSTKYDGKDYTDEPAPYVPNHPVSVEAIVTLANGEKVTVVISERESVEKGSLYGALLPAGVLIGKLSRSVQAELREAREGAARYSRGH